MEIQLRARGVYWVTMDTEEEPTHVIDKAIFLNEKDEAFQILMPLYFSRPYFPSLEIEDSKGNLGQIGHLVWKTG